MKKLIVVVASTSLLLAATAPSMVSTVQAEQVIPNTEISAQSTINDIPSSGFISKFDEAVKLVNNQFVIDYNNLPQNTTATELQNLKILVEQKNSIISKSESLKEGFKVEKDNNSIIISSATDNDSLQRYRYGSNYVHVYWWGLRIGINKGTTIAAVRVGCTIGSVYVPARAVIAALGVLGLAASNIPGGIVFNSSPQFVPIAGSGAIVWGVGFQ